MAHSESSNKKECCKDKDKNEPNLIKATDLPRHGNPYPPKDVILEDKPSLIERKITSFRSTIQPYTEPIGLVYGRVSDFAATGMAHSSSMFQRLLESQNSIVQALVISAAGLLGAAISRRRRILGGAIFATGATAACYPNEATEGAQMMWYIAKNKLPEVAKQQYDRLFNAKQEIKEESVMTTTDAKPDQSN